MRGRRARYEEFWALEDVSLEVAEGATFGLIGDERLRQEHAAQVHGPDPARRTRASSRSRGKISALLELGAGFHPELSGRENVYLNGVDPRAVEEGASTAGSTTSSSFAGLEQFIDTPVKNYSSGHVRAARVRGGHQRRPRHPARRRGAGRRRRGVPAALQREVRRPAGTGQDHRDRVALARLRARHVRRGGLARARPAARRRARRAIWSTSTSPRSTRTGAARAPHRESLGLRRGPHRAHRGARRRRVRRPIDVAHR